MPWGKQHQPGSAWTTRSAEALRWQLDAIHLSNASRMNKVEPLKPSIIEGSLDYAFKLRNEFPWFVASDNQVFVTSGVTRGAP